MKENIKRLTNDKGVVAYRKAIDELSINAREREREICT